MRGSNGWVPILAVVAACAQLDQRAPEAVSVGPASQEQDLERQDGGEAFGRGGARAKREEGKVGRKNGAAQLEALGYIADAKTVEENAPKEAPPPPGAPAPGADEGAPVTRQWFPEAFLWRPLVETDASGQASVEVRVPDSLTTWRVLGLAHDAGGHQAGSVATFDSTLPLYVDPVVPGWLYSGDRLVVPVQVVNTTTGALSGELRVTASGAASGAGGGGISLGAGDSGLSGVALTASGSGEAQVLAELRSSGGSDAAERTIPVYPSGRPVVATRGGTLSDKRSLTLASPEGADGATQALRVRVWSGPLSLLQGELERVGATPPEDGAYGYALAGRLSAMAASTGAQIDGKALRNLEIKSWQRVWSSGMMAPGAPVAAQVLTGTAGITGNELVDGLRPRLVAAVVGAQRGDGTWALRDQDTLQGVLVHTAWMARSLPEDQPGPKLRAAGSVQRYLREVKDPYTAAVLVGSGLVTGPTADLLREQVARAVVDGDGGAKTVTSPPAGTQNPWGYPPSRAEVLAWTWLALADQADASSWRGDLLAELMSGYDARWGFGAGPADVVALEALSEGLPTLSAPVKVTLRVNGAAVAEATVDPSQPKVPGVLLAHPGGGVVSAELVAEPAVPGLAFTAELDSWVPWRGDEALPGVEVRVRAESLAVGDDGTLVFEVVAPSGSVVKLTQGLPAGASVQDPSNAALAEFRSWTDRVELTTQRFTAGQIVTVEVPVRPAFAGTFSTAPLAISVDGGAPVALPPLTWTVGEG